MRVFGGNLISLLFFLYACNLSAQEVKEPNVAGAFYPDDPRELSREIDNFLDSADPRPVEADITALICPHAGYAFSGQAAAFGYKLVKGRPYKTAVVIGPSHHLGFRGVSIYPQGSFRTPLGELEIDKDLAEKLLYKDKDIYFEPAAFEKEHSVEVQLPFLQKVFPGIKIVPIVTGNASLAACQRLAGLLKEAIGGRKDVLVIASTDMYHGYDHDQADLIDGLTLSYLEKMDAPGLYEGLEENRLQLCGGVAAVTTLIMAKDLGCDRLYILRHTNSAEVTGRKTKGTWTVGYSSCALTADRGIFMLNKDQKKRLLMIARNSIENYLNTGQMCKLSDIDPLLNKEMGSFVTLHKQGNLRGCIGSLIGRQPLCFTVRDMAVEAALNDPRFSPLTQNELEDVEIEISVLSPLKKVDSVDEIIMGTHGVLVRSGFNSGVFLPQVAVETKWSKEDFLSELCSQKAGLSRDAWKEKSTEIYIFTAEVFSEKEL